jgi:hypothetical protein
MFSPPHPPSVVVPLVCKTFARTIEETVKLVPLKDELGVTVIDVSHAIAFAEP